MGFGPGLRTMSIGLVGRKCGMTRVFTEDGASIPVTLIEQLPDAAEDQRAATVHPPTVEMLVDLGLEREAFSEEPSGGKGAGGTVNPALLELRQLALGRLDPSIVATMSADKLTAEVERAYRGGADSGGGY